MNLRNPLCALLFATLPMAVLLVGCESRDDRARAAFDKYQAATAASDLPGARLALLELVAEDDRVASYWVELGKTQLAMSDLGGAYNAFLRAHELDRANAEILGILTQLALRAGDLQQAEAHARNLELVAPNDPAVRLTYGYAALRRGDNQGATEQVEELLAAAPYDPSAKVLQSRILLNSGKPDEAVAVLREQIRLQPSDQLALRSLLAIHERRDHWPEASVIARELVRWQPKDLGLRQRLIEAELRAREIEAARAHTVIGLKGADPAQIDRLLASWIATGQEVAISRAVFDAAKSSTGSRRLALARFLSAAGKPGPVLMLTRDLASVPVRTANLEANALLGTALALSSQGRAGMDRLDAVLMLDPGNNDALRGRALALSQSGKHERAIEDARKLVSASRTSAPAWLLLAKIYAVAGHSDSARRTLWEAFHELPANHAVHDALRSFLLKSEGPGAAARLSQEFEDQRSAAMARSFA